MSSKFMTVFRPEAVQQEDSPNETLEKQREGFVKTEKGENVSEEDLVKEKVDDKIKDLQVAAASKKKSLHEVVEDQEKDKEAKEKVEKQVKEELKSEKPVQQKQVKEVKKTSVPAGDK